MLDNGATLVTAEEFISSCKSNRHKKARIAAGFFVLNKWCPDAESNHGHGDYQARKQ
jgi:hypothetical protein